MNKQRNRRNPLHKLGVGVKWDDSSQHRISIQYFLPFSPSNKQKKFSLFHSTKKFREIEGQNVQFITLLVHQKHPGQQARPKMPHEESLNPDHKIRWWSILSSGIPLNGFYKYLPVGRMCSREASLLKSEWPQLSPIQCPRPWSLLPSLPHVPGETLEKECSSGLLGQQQKLSKTRMLENSRFHSTFYVNHKLTSS